MKENTPNFIKALSRGPNFVARKFNGYLINGYRFHTRRRDVRRKTQNSGVTLMALTTSFASSKDDHPITTHVSYYGRINDMFELDYYGYGKVVVFGCDWFEAQEDMFGLTYVHFNKRCYHDEPFILASQAHQCFYIQDPFEENKHYVMKTLPRDLFSMSDEPVSNAQEFYIHESSTHSTSCVMANDYGGIDLVRSDIPETIIDMATTLSAEIEEEDSDFD